MNIILNADDFGINESVTRCIASLFDAGKLHQTSLMVNMPYADEAVEIAKAKGFADKVGLHLNITEGMPLTEPIKKRPLFCDESGRFNKCFYKSLFHRFVLGKEDKLALKTEIEAQLKKFINYGGLRLHIDSHHHAHWTHWSVFAVMRPLLHKYGFKSVRICQNIGIRRYKQPYICAYNKMIRSEFETTEYFGGWSQALLDCLDKSGSLEIMVHPMYGADGAILDSVRPYESILVALKAHKCSLVD